jgi:signal transduction histidine kinase
LEVSLSLNTKYILFATVILTIVIGAFYHQNLKHQEEQIREDDRTRALLVAEIIKNGLVTIMIEEGRSVDLRNFIETMVAEDIESIRLYGTKDDIIASSVPLESGKKVKETSAPSNLKPGLTFRSENGKSFYNINMPIFNEKICQACHMGDEEVMSTLNVSMPLDKTIKKIQRMKGKTTIYFVFTLIVLSALLALMTTYLVKRPIKEIVNIMREVEGGDFNARFITNRKDEIGLLGTSLNSMLSELCKMRQELETYHIEAMQKVEKMATIGELAAAIAHEIKNPLAGISGAIQVFAEDFEPEDPRREIIMEVQNEIERLDKAVRNLITFAKPPEPSFIRTPIDELIDRTMRLIKTQAKKQGIDVNIVSLEEKAEVYIDPDQIQQVFLNIMLNAIHSMPAGGSLTVTTLVRPEEGEVEVSISDTGSGISEENLQNVFKPFFTTKHTGTGLGLAISKNIIEKHKGRLVAESKVASGSHFRIILPLEMRDA